MDIDISVLKILTSIHPVRAMPDDPAAMQAGKHAFIPDRYCQQSHFLERTPEEYSRRLRELTEMLAIGPGGPAERYWEIVDLLDGWELADRDWVKVLKLEAVQERTGTTSSCEPTAAPTPGWISVADKVSAPAVGQIPPCGRPTTVIGVTTNFSGALSDRMKSELIAKNKEIALRRRAEKDELDQRSRAHRLLQQLGKPY